MARDDESMDSIVGMTGSMVDLVKGAREVRRLIREASFDSLASEFSLDFQVFFTSFLCTYLIYLSNKYLYGHNCARRLTLWYR